MLLDWDAAPGPVRKYIITYKPEEGEVKEVSSPVFMLAQITSVQKFGLTHQIIFCSVFQTNYINLYEAN